MNLSGNFNPATSVVTRFAPSPTGFMTIGNFRTALFSYLFAKKNQGEFLIRIEDTDRERSLDSHTQQILKDLRAMGLDFDESKILHQSQRTHIYETYYQQLQENGAAYECFCTPDELALERKVQLASGQPPRYSGRCLHLSAEEKQKRKEAGAVPTLRFHVGHQKVSFVDLIMGPKEFSASDIGDFIIKKADGQATFFFCNAIDDALSGVTHVLRGDDHLTNTPRQILLLEKLGLPLPHYGHFPLILGYDHKPLSKRTGSRSIKELLEEGFLADGINNYLSRLGHQVPSQEYLGLVELIKHFDLDLISKGAAHYDQAQLNYWQKIGFSHLNVETGMQLIAQKVPQLIESKKAAFWSLVQANILCSGEMKSWYDRLTQQDALISLDVLKDFGWDHSIIELLSSMWGNPWAEVLSTLKEKGFKGKTLFMPLRLLMTGLEDGPPLEALYLYIDQDVMKNRLRQVLS
jgi:nondiscriminating glutamyl-tRNA synthetase